MTNENKVVPGFYVCGWAKRGSVGVIDSTIRDVKETFSMIFEDF